MRFLLFRLHGPMASWGEVAVGERRPSSDHPTRSAVLGLVAAALGLRRDQSEPLTALFRGYGFGCRVDAPGTLLVDYHTAQVAPEQALKKRPRPSVRAEELAFPKDDLSTMLSTRDYRCDALATACLWPRDGAPWSLEQLQEALRRPAFVLYLGRKSCPVDVPLSPRIVEADHPTRALASTDPAEARFLDEVCAQTHFDGMRWALQNATRGQARFYWERSEADATSPHPGVESRRRRDDPRSRTRWQFNEREELFALAPGAPAAGEEDHEPALSDAHSPAAGGPAGRGVLAPAGPGRLAPSPGLAVLCQGRAR